MSEDDSTLAPDGSDKPSEKRRTWLDRLSSAFSGEPSTRDDLMAILRDAQSDGLIAGDTLKMMEGAIAVADLTVGDVMVPRAQMVSLPVEARFLDERFPARPAALRAQWLSEWRQAACEQA